MNKAIFQEELDRTYPCGTNRQSKDIDLDVIKNHLRVHEIKGLTVVDAIGSSIVHKQHHNGSYHFSWLFIIYSCAAFS